jgi:predicted aldo/keto reductase-like oxidoreductase
MELRGALRGRDITEQQAEVVLNKVLDSGINYIDTSIDYGLSEPSGLQRPGKRGNLARISQAD